MKKYRRILSAFMAVLSISDATAIQKRLAKIDI